MKEIKDNYLVYSYTPTLAILIIDPLPDYEPQYGTPYPLSHTLFSHPQQICPLTLLAQLIILHKCILTPQLLKLLGSMFFSLFAGVGVGDGGLQTVNVRRAVKRHDLEEGLEVEEWIWNGVCVCVCVCVRLVRC